jgi:hypothetical protein
VTGGRPASELLALPVRMHGIQLGKPVDALFDRHADRLVGLELRCGDGEHRFLPFSVANVRADEIEVSSALALMDERQLDFYRGHARSLAELGLSEPWIDDDGTVHEARSAG